MDNYDEDRPGWLLEADDDEERARADDYDKDGLEQRMMKMTNLGSQ